MPTHIHQLYSFRQSTAGPAPFYLSQASAFTRERQWLAFFTGPESRCPGCGDACQLQLQQNAPWLTRDRCATLLW